MELKHQLKRYASIYRVAHAERWKTSNWKWRVFVILSAALVILSVYQYLYLTYLGVAFTSGHPETFSINEKLFYWFMTGFILGAIAVALMIEGEFLLGIRTIAKALEREKKLMGRDFEKGVKQVEKEMGLKTPKEKRKRRKYI